MNKLFESHHLNAAGLIKLNRISTQFDDLLNYLETVCAECRELAIARRELEIACFYSKKAVAQEKENQQ